MSSHISNVTLYPIGSYHSLTREIGPLERFLTSCTLWDCHTQDYHLTSLSTLANCDSTVRFSTLTQWPWDYYTHREKFPSALRWITQSLTSLSNSYSGLLVVSFYVKGYAC